MSGDPRNMNVELISKSPYDTPGADEKSALRKGKKAEMNFRIEKGYEKDNLFTRMKYFFSCK